LHQRLIRNRLLTIHFGEAIDPAAAVARTPLEPGFGWPSAAMENGSVGDPETGVRVKYWT
jgi:hypothetical protein